VINAPALGVRWSGDSSPGTEIALARAAVLVGMN